MNGRHTEFFGPDLGRGPFSSTRIETAALQIATALAQLRAPVSRSDDDLRAHVNYIRELADRLAPDWAAQIALDVGPHAGGAIQTTIRAAIGAYSLLDCWLADTTGGPVSSTAPDSVIFASGAVLETLEPNKRFLVIAPTTGVVDVTVTYAGVKTWRWAVSRYARVYYSSALSFS